MQVFCPFSSPLETAKCLDPKRLNRQIQEAKVILNAISRQNFGTGKGLFNHPIVKMYGNNFYYIWLERYYSCLLEYQKYIKTKDIFHLHCSEDFSIICDKCKPLFLTEEFCIQHRRRLYTKDKEYYKQFAEYGESEENWYCIGGEIVKYINGKRIE